MIILKYTQDYKRPKFRFGTGFYVLVALCFIIIGSASWFMLSSYTKNRTVPKSQNGSEYRDKTSSYNESVPQNPVNEAEDVAQNVSSEPYSSPKNTVSAPAKISFTMPVQGRISKDYSSDRLQYSATFGDMRLHKGIDIECEKGTAVSACADGTVLSVTNDAMFGTVLEIDHKNGIVVKYAALDDVKLKESDAVKMGDIIGKVATVPCECNDKSHIHIEVLKDGKQLSPLKTLGLS